MDSSREPDGDTLPAKHRIEEVALRLFAERGEAGVSLREIARTAGVTPGLVIHHFGSKDGLRRQVDHKIISAFSEMLSEIPAEDSSQSIRRRYARLDPLLEENPAMVGYLRRLLLEREESGEEFFQRIMDFAFSDIRQHSEDKSPYTEEEVARIFEGMVQTWGPLLLSPLSDHMRRYLRNSPAADKESPANLPDLHITTRPPQDT